MAQIRRELESPSVLRGVRPQGDGVALWEAKSQAVLSPACTLRPHSPPHHHSLRSVSACARIFKLQL